jgi:hypothetical protein
MVAETGVEGGVSSFSGGSGRSASILSLLLVESAAMAATRKEAEASAFLPAIVGLK